MKIVKKYKSKKNSVFLSQLGQKQTIVKRFKDNKQFEKELKVYKELDDSQNLAPKLYSFSLTEKELYLEYINGNTLTEYLEIAENERRVDDAVEILINLIEWFDNFHSCNLSNFKNHVLNDVNFNNFIISKNKIVGIDFEDVKEGDSLDDYIKILSMYLLYDPIKSNFKKEVFNKLLIYLSVKFSMCKKQILCLVNLEEINIIQRRSRYKRI